MRTAFLFNSDSPDLGGYYGYPIKKMILAAGALQKTNRNMVISLGDVLTYGRLITVEQLRCVYEPHSWDRRKIEMLEATYNKATVYCWVFTNITQDIAEELHDKLYKQSCYLGAIDLNYAYLPHFAFFANGLIPKYRLHNKTCYLFYSMGENEERDVEDDQEFSEAGYKIEQEDTGARHTIFDNYYDSVEHFRRVEHFSTFFIEELDWSPYDISELGLNIEELHPYLFSILYAAAQTLKTSEVKEQLSQAYLSGRRFIEHVADFLYPPKSELHKCWDGKEREVKADNYTNRIAAYIENTLQKAGRIEAETLATYGKSTSELYEIFCRGVHKPFSAEDDFKEEKERCKMALSKLGHWTSALIEIDPASVRRPYLAYEKEILKLFNKGIAA